MWGRDVPKLRKDRCYSCGKRKHDLAGKAAKNPEQLSAKSKSASTNDKAHAQKIEHFVYNLSSMGNPADTLKFLAEILVSKAVLWFSTSKITQGKLISKDHDVGYWHKVTGETVINHISNCDLSALTWLSPDTLWQMFRLLVFFFWNGHAYTIKV